MTRVLIIDADFENTKLLSEHLTQEGYEVETASRAKEGFSLAFKSPHDVIFLEDVLPDGTAFQVVGKFRKNPLTKTVPIIMFSRSAAQQSTAKFIGANDCILKPFYLTDVDIHLHKLLGEKAKGTMPPLPAEPKPEEAKPAAEATASTAPETAIPGQAPVPSAVPGAENSEAKKDAEVPMAGPELMPIHSEIKIAREVEIAIPQRTYESPALVPYQPMQAVEQPVQYGRRVEDQPDRLRSNYIPATDPYFYNINEPPAAAASPSSPEAIPQTSRPPAALGGPKIGRRSSDARLAWFVFILYAGLSVGNMAMATHAPAALFQTAVSIAGGIAFLLGLLVALTVAMHIELSAVAVVQIVAWAYLPVLLRTLGSLLSHWVPALEPLRMMETAQLPSAAYWLRPYDIFQMASALIVWFSLIRLPGGSVKKSIIAGLVIAFAFSLPNHQSLQPATSVPARPQEPVVTQTPVPVSVPAPVVTVPAPVPTPTPVPAPSAAPKAQTPAQRPNEAKGERKEVVQENQLKEFRLLNLLKNKKK